jgi:hypothetical protein
MLPSPGYPMCCSSSWPGLLPRALPAVHIIRKLQLGQRVCVLFLLISFVYFVNIFLLQRFSRPNPQVLCSSSSTNIRIPSASIQHLVPAFHPGSQLGQTCIFPAFDDGTSSPCLLNLFDHDYTAPFSSHTLLAGVFIFSLCQKS